MLFHEDYNSATTHRIALRGISRFRLIPGGVVFASPKLDSGFTQRIRKEKRACIIYAPRGCSLSANNKIGCPAGLKWSRWESWSIIGNQTA